MTTRIYIRGVSWGSLACYVRAEERDWFAPSFRNSYAIGFRIVRSFE